MTPSLDRLNSAYDPAQFRQQGHAVVDLLADWLAHKQDRSQPLQHFRKPDDQAERWADDRPTDLPLTAFLAKVLEGSMCIHHPRYMGHQVAPTLPVTAVTALVSALLNNGMAIYEMGPVASILEQRITRLFCDNIGYNSASGGILTSGGTLANLTALLTARSKKAPSDVWRKGHQQRLVILVSEQAHYCIDRAARIMGLGDTGIIRVPVDAQFRMRHDLLPGLIAQARGKGLFPIAVVAAACSPSTGSYDDIAALADCCAAHDLWLHVDGAHGGAVIFSETHKMLVRGIERADSVVIDCHKMLLCPGIITATLYREQQDSACTFSQQAEYLWASQLTQEWYEPGKRTFECTKRMMSMIVWSALQQNGVQLWRDYIDHQYKMTRTFADYIEQQPDFELALRPESNILCFRYTGRPTDQATLRDKVLRQGDFYIVQTQLHGITWLRLTLMNHMTQLADLTALLEQLRAYAAEC